MKRQRFTIFGAGLSGALLAVYLSRRGHAVDLYERRPDPRLKGAERGRSINLALSTRGIEALRAVGLAEEVLATAIPMKGRMIHARSGEISFQPYSSGAELAINSISRSGLNAVLLTAAEREAGVRIHFDQRCVNADVDSGRVEVLDGASGQARWIDTQTMIGADGAFSAIRGAMQRRDRFEYEQSYLEHGYKELTIPPVDGGGGFRMEKHALHIWPRGTFMMIALPNADGSFTCTLFWPYSGPNSFQSMRSGAEAAEFFRREFADAVPLIPDLAADWEHNPVASLVTVRCWPWHVGSRAALLGDAAHAVVPFYGQGMNASFEDVRVLAECIDDSPNDLAAAYSEYAQRRKPHTDALSRLAVENFYEMRDKVSSPAFRRKKTIEHVLEKLFPAWYVSLYHMVTFTTIPYGEAVARARTQQRTVRHAAIAGLLLLVVVLAVAAWLLLRPAG